MKRILSLLLVLVMVLSLAGCGNDSDPSAAPEQGGDPQSGQRLEATEAPTEEPTAEPTPEPTEEPQDDLEGILGEYDPATYTYTNKFLGFTCTMDEDWTVLSQEEIAQLMGTVADISTDEDLVQALETSGTVEPFCANAEDGFLNLVVTVEDLGLLYGSILDEEGYADISYDSIAPALESMGFTDVETERGTTLFLDEEHIYITARGYLPIEGIDPVEFYETLICVKRGRHMAVFTVSSYMVDVTNKLMAYFSAI